MKQGWEIKTLKDCFKLKSGDGLTSKNMSADGAYRVFGGNGIAGLHNDFNLSGSNVIIGRVGALCGNVRHMNEKIWLTDNAFRIVDYHYDFDHRFLTYLLNFKNLREYARQAAQPVISNSSLKDVILEFPKSVAEQQRIVAILDEAFAAIARAKSNAEQNLSNAKELFESYLDALFNKLFQTREKKIISDLAKVIGGYSFKSTEFTTEGKYQVIRMGNVRPGIIREKESPVFIGELDEKVITKARLQLNDVIITQTGTKKKRDYGFTVIIEKENYLLNQRIAAIRFSDKYHPKFFLYFSWTNLFKDQYFAKETGTVGQGNVGIGAITVAEIPFIPVKEQKQIIESIDKLSIETQRLEAIYQMRINDLEELKKSILQKAFSGQLSESGFAGLKDGQDFGNKKKAGRSSN